MEDRKDKETRVGMNISEYTLLLLPPEWICEQKTVERHLIAEDGDQELVIGSLSSS